jgi:hypothetical protein
MYVECDIGRTPRSSAYGPRLWQLRLPVLYPPNAFLNYPIPWWLQAKVKAKEPAASQSA